MLWVSLAVVAVLSTMVWMAWRRPRQTARVAPFVSPALRAGRNLPRERRKKGRAQKLGGAGGSGRTRPRSK